MKRELWFWLGAAAMGMATAACGDGSEVTGSGGSTSDGGSGGTSDVGGAGGDGGSGAAGGGGSLMPGHRPVDVLLVVDNSRGMQYSRAVLSESVPSLVQHFTNPTCLDGDGMPAAQQPNAPDESCPTGTARRFPPVTDLHVGVISSSLGGHGSDACSGSFDPSENDRAHLLDRAEGGGTVSTYDGLGFLAWDPLAQKDPAGTASSDVLLDRLGSMVSGVGALGCGYEATLESWYRFLVDPNPYDTIAIQNGSAQLQGTDTTVMDQRAQFLRDDSALVIVMLSDENDCSIRDGGANYLAAQIFNPSNPSQLFHPPRARSECATDPNDPCCRSCAGPQGNCPADPTCNMPLLSAAEDSINLRCFDQKRRFGIDFLYPLSRYTDALTATDIADRDGNVVPNPLFSGGRSPSDVFLTGIVGVPWQDIAREAGGAPDLAAGLDANGQPVGGYQSAAELTQNARWDVIVGDVEAYVNPTDPLMQESVEPRTGTHPVTGDAVAGTMAGYLANPINGHEYTTDNSDLQYTCIYPLPQPVDCTQAGAGVPCECTDPNNDNPVCQGQNGAQTTTQYFAKAYPGRRQLSVIQSLGSQGVVGSICPAQLDDPSGPTFAYQPTMRALAEAVAGRLTP